MCRTVPSNCGNSRRRYRGRSDTDNSSMSRVQSCSRTITVLHQRFLTYKQTPPRFFFYFLVAYMSRSNRVSIQISWWTSHNRRPFFEPSLGEITEQASLCSFKKCALARRSSTLRPSTYLTLSKLIDGKGGLCFIVRSLCRTTPFQRGVGNGMVLIVVKSCGKSVLDIQSESRLCKKPVNTNCLDLVLHDGRFLAGRITLELTLWKAQIW